MDAKEKEISFEPRSLDYGYAVKHWAATIFLGITLVYLDTWVSRGGIGSNNGIDWYFGSLWFVYLFSCPAPLIGFCILWLFSKTTWPIWVIKFILLMPSALLLLGFLYLLFGDEQVDSELVRSIVYFLSVIILTGMYFNLESKPETE